MNTLKVTPKDFFLWAAALIALYGSVTALITLLFEYINYAYPDPLSYNYVDPFSGSMRFAMATLIVLVPLALFLMRLIRNDIAKESAKADLWIRRWALFLTVFLAGAIVIGDLITLINYFLGGDLTTRFVFKVLVVLLIAGGAFLHFLADLRGYWSAQPMRAQMVGWGAGMLVLASIVAGFFIMGTPGEVRLVRFDAEKVQNLQSIQYQIVEYYQQKGMVPAQLADIEDSLSGWRVPQDPQGGDYRYQKKGELSFSLCADFNKETPANQTSAARPTYYGEPVLDENWEHGAGEVCFDRTIDPDRYPLYEKPVPVR